MAAIYDQGYRLITGADWKAYLKSVDDALVTFASGKISGFNAGSAYVRDIMPVEDLLVGNSNMTSTIYPVSTNIETMDTLIPAGTSGWYYALSGQLGQDRAISIYGFAMAQSSLITGVRAGFTKTIAGGVQLVQSLEHLGDSNGNNLFVIFSNPLKVAKNDLFWLQLNALNANASVPVVESSYFLARTVTGQDNRL